MKKILTAEQMKRCDAFAIDSLGISSRTLMSRAAKACVDSLDGFDLSRVCVICGAGNNGGDGMAIADILCARNVDVTVVFVGDEARCTPESAYRLERLRDLCVPVVDFASASSVLQSATTIVDALFGIGLTRPAAGESAQIIASANDSPAAIISVDVPSGLYADGGAIAGEAIRARRTVAIQNMKPCHVLYPAALNCGEVRVADIGIPDSVIECDDPILFVTDDDISLIADRAEYSHKGTFGRVLVIAGCEGMAGAAYLCALAAYRSGAGLVEVFTVEANRGIIQTLLPEAIVTTYGDGDLNEKIEKSLSRSSAAVIGPGLGMSELSRRVTRLSLDFAACPLVIDADALNIIAKEKLALPRRADVAVTPHLAEMSRLADKPVSDIAADLVGAARRFAAENGVVCVLKDAHTVVCGGGRVFVNLAGCSAMAKGGSGDVLTGIIAALAASGVDMTTAAALGCHLHGRAGERAAALHGLHGVLARDIANEVRR